MRIIIFALPILLTIAFVGGEAINQLSLSYKKTRRIAISDMIKENIQGKIYFTQERPRAPVIIRGLISGLEKGNYSLDIHENGDLTNDCTKLGPIVFFNSKDKGSKGTKITSQPHIGQLGFFESDTGKMAAINLVSRFASLFRSNKIVGRSLAVKLEGSEIPSIVLCGIIESINHQNID